MTHKIFIQKRKRYIFFYKYDQVENRTQKNIQSFTENHTETLKYWEQAAIPPHHCLREIEVTNRRNSMYYDGKHRSSFCFYCCCSRLMAQTKIVNFWLYYTAVFRIRRFWTLSIWPILQSHRIDLGVDLDKVVDLLNQP